MSEHGATEAIISRFESADAIVTALREILIEECSPELSTRFVFRGQGHSEWRLVPSAFRPAAILGFENRQFTRMAAEVPKDTWDQGNAEFVALMEFLSLADSVGLELPVDHEWLRRWNPFHNAVGDWIGTREWPPRELYEALAIAQHHGVPTRLLDFTYDPMIAAFFASEKPHPGADEVAVWCVDLETLAVAAPFGLHGDLDVVTVPRQRNRNLSAQRGLFLISRRESRLSCPLETSLSEVLKNGVVSGRLAEGTCAVRKLCLSTAECPRLLELLRKLGVDRAHLMPSFDGVVAELKSRLERRQAQHIPLVGTDPTAGHG